MNIVLEPDVEQWIAQEAARAHITPELFIQQRLQEQANLSRHLAAMPDEEARLLEKINEGFPAEFWQQYRVLIQKRDAEKLSDAERAELIRYSDQVEQKNAERAPYLLALAHLRSTSLPELVRQLGLRPTAING